MLNVGVLISGSGTNLQALIDACAQVDYPARIRVVISNQPEARGIERAQKANIPVEIVHHGDYSSRELFDRHMDEVLRQHQVEFVCLAGFMRLLSPWFVKVWHNKMVNTHPSLLPAFKGVNAQQQALAYGVKLTGCTLHFVRDEMDVGPIIMQRAVPIIESDTVETLRTKILREEHQMYVQALLEIAQGNVTVHNEKVIMMTSAP